MTPRNRSRLEARARVFKAMAHPARLLFMEVLAQGERCVCELAELAEADMSTASKHLSVLRNAGLVRSDKRGLQVFYTLRVPCVLNFLSCVESILKTNAKEQAALTK